MRQCGLVRLCGSGCWARSACGTRAKRPPCRPRLRVLLCALLVRPGRVVPVTELAEAVWGAGHPDAAEVTLRSYVKRLRQALGPAGARIATRSPGYQIEVAEDELDILRFASLVRAGGAAVRTSAWQPASDLLHEALGLWRGAPLADVASDVLHRTEVPRLDQLRLQAMEWRIEADLNLDHPDAVVPGLQALTEDHPFREHFHGQLMVALCRCGRQAEALAAYQAARRVLVDELAAEPGPQLQRLHQRILAGDPALAGETGGSARPAAAAPPPAGAVVPRQLPAAVRHFTGRAAELAVLDGLLAETGSPGGAVVISAIGGTAGVGKTALAVHWAQRVSRLFPRRAAVSEPARLRPASRAAGAAGGDPSVP
jgi:DNA-binding SARP family transcriptional activator